MLDSIGLNRMAKTKIELLLSHKI